VNILENAIKFNGITLSEQEQRDVNGGAGWITIIATIATAAVAVFECGKAVGQVAYKLTH
jgi:hypothetical protein